MCSFKDREDITEKVLVFFEFDVSFLRIFLFMLVCFRRFVFYKLHLLR